MKKIKCLIVGLILLLVINNSFAEQVMLTQKDRVEVVTVCIDGQLFAVASHGGRFDVGRGVSIVQIYKTNSTHLPPQPKECN